MLRLIRRPRMLDFYRSSGSRSGYSCRNHGCMGVVYGLVAWRSLGLYRRFQRDWARIARLDLIHTPRIIVPPIVEYRPRWLPICRFGALLDGSRDILRLLILVCGLGSGLFLWFRFGCAPGRYLVRWGRAWAGAIRLLSHRRRGRRSNRCRRNGCVAAWLRSLVASQQLPVGFRRATAFSAGYYSRKCHGHRRARGRGRWRGIAVRGRARLYVDGRDGGGIMRPEAASLGIWLPLRHR